MGFFSSIFKGLLSFIVPKKPPSPPRQVAIKDDKRIDPSKSNAREDAIRKRRSLTSRTGRSALRVDLTDRKSSTRAGISIK